MSALAAVPVTFPRAVEAPEDVPAGVALPELVLLVDSSTASRERVASVLESGEYAAVAVATTSAAAALFRSAEFAFVILHANSRSDVFELCASIRGSSTVPIVMLIPADDGNADLEARLRGFDSGADACLSDAAEPAELTRQLQALGRRRHEPLAGDAEELQGPGGLLMRPAAHQVFVHDQPVVLTSTQFRVFAELLSARGVVLSAERISLAVWGHGTGGSKNFVEAQLSRLRRALRDAGAPDMIENVRGVG